MSAQVVFNLYPFSESLYLPSVFLVQTGAGGELTYALQRATPATLAPQGIELSPLLGQLFDLVDMLVPKQLETRFKPPKAKAPTPLPQLLAEPATKPFVERFIYEKLDALLSALVQHQLPLTFDLERKTLAKNVQVAFAADELVPHIAFTKTAEGVEYRFQLGTEDEKWPIRSREVLPLTNTDPAWLLIDYVLFRVPGINGNMVKPFRTKDVVHIPPDKARVYFKQFVAKSAGRTRIEAEGFALHNTSQLDATRISPTENVLENAWYLKPVFLYPGAEFPYGDRREHHTAVDFSDDGSEEVVLRQVQRDAALEQQRVDFLEQLGLKKEGRLWRVGEIVADNASLSLGPTPSPSPQGEGSGYELGLAPLPLGRGAGAKSAAGASSLDTLLHWLSSHKTLLESNGFILEVPTVEGKPLALLNARLDLRAQAAGDWFDVRGRVEVGSFSFPFKALWPNLRRRDRFYRLPDGAYFLIPETWFARYAELAEAAQDGPEDALRLPKALFTLLQNAGLGQATEGVDFPEIDPEKIDFQPSPDLKADLRPYQLQGVKWLVGHYRAGFGACLADDMGLGKTLQTIALLLYAKAQRGGDGETANSATQLDLFQSYRQELRPLNALIILPASLVFNWQNEIGRFAPSLFTYAHIGPKRLSDARALAGHDVVLTTYHTARQDLDLLSKVNWHVIVLDESQQIKNRASEVSKVVLSLRADCKISLSGTPIENSLSDLWTQMEFINPATLGSFSAFREQFIVPIEKRDDPVAKQRLFSRVRPFFLRRTKEQVAPELPALSEQLFFSEMSAAQEKLYERTKSAVRNEILALFDDPKTRVLALQALTRLRQIACDPRLIEADYAGGSGKFDDVLAQWDTVRRAGHKVLFFSSFERHLQLFRREFEAAGQPFAWLTGDTATPDRAREVKRFQEDPSVQAFFMTVKAGGVGLNLTAADYVFLLDPWWNPAAEDQAIARAHRIGQTRPVTALRFLSHGTIEEKIRQLQERKKKLGQELFATGEEAPALSREDMELLLV